MNSASYIPSDVCLRLIVTCCFITVSLETGCSNAPENLYHHGY